MKQTIAVLGAGSWGTALAQVQAQAGHNVILWDRKQDLLEAIAKTGENATYHPGIQLSSNIRPEPQMKVALENADFVVLSIPSNGFREILSMAKPFLKMDAILVNSAKGLDEETLRPLSETAAEILSEPIMKRSFSVLSGPSFAVEVMRNLPTAVTVAAFNPATAKKVQTAFHTNLFFVFTSDDVIGVEIAGALKNVMAIATGAVDGLGFGHNSRAGLITRGLAEISKIGQAMGAHPLTFSGLAGIGDLLLTCTSDLSRNRRVGFKLAQGESLRTLMKEIGQVAEGIRTVKSAYLLAKNLNIEAPILTEMYQCLYERKSPEQAIKDLLSRPPMNERD